MGNHDQWPSMSREPPREKVKALLCSSLPLQIYISHPTLLPRILQPGATTFQETSIGRQRARFLGPYSPIRIFALRSQLPCSDVTLQSSSSQTYPDCCTLSVTGIISWHPVAAVPYHGQTSPGTLQRLHELRNLSPAKMAHQCPCEFTSAP